MEVIKTIGQGLTLITRFNTNSDMLDISVGGGVEIIITEQIYSHWKFLENKGREGNYIGV